VDGAKSGARLACFHSLKTVHDQRGWDALVAIRYSIQKPRPRHPNAAGEEEREALKKNYKTPPKKKHKSIRTPPSRSGRWMSTGSA